MGFLALPLPAQTPKIRTHIETPPPLYTGQRITLVIELLAPGYFDSAATFELPDRQSLLLMPPADSPSLSIETSGGTTYTVQRYELATFAAQPGQQTIPPFTVRFGYKLAPLDKTALHAELTTQPVPLEIMAPPGAGHLGFVISARDLTATETWAPQPPGAQAVPIGNAFTRTITFSAPDVPGMIFPPFPAGNIDGLSLYRKPPEILDTSGRGALTGKRRDIITYVCEHTGQFTIPAARLVWFDLDAQKLRTIDFPARTFTVAANPALPENSVAPTAHDGSPEAGRAPVGRLLIALCVPGVLALIHLCRRRIKTIIEPLRPVHLRRLNPP